MKTLVRGLYAIADADLLAGRSIDLHAFADQLRAAGVAALQLRDKTGPPARTLERADVLRRVFAGDRHTPLLMNDRVDLALLAGFDGVHLGQTDMDVEDARLAWRKAQGEEAHVGPGLIGISTHTGPETREAGAGSADYVAIGPVFATGTKLDAAPVVGLEGVRRARASTTKPLVAIGGITRSNARSVIEAGADCLAVISALLLPGESVEKVARDFIDIFG